MADKAIFLDRDNTLIEDPGYINHPDQVRLLRGVAKALIDFKSMGYKLIVITNQSGVARGILTENVLSDIHERLNLLLSNKGAQLDAIYYCPYHPDGIIPKYMMEHNDRKPNPGMILRASKELGIDLNSSWVIGNSSRDIEAGKRANCKTILLRVKKNKPGLPSMKNNNAPKPDYEAVNMKEAVNIVKKQYRMELKETRKRSRNSKLIGIEEPPEQPSPPRRARKRTIPVQQIVEIPPQTEDIAEPAVVSAPVETPPKPEPTPPAPEPKLEPKPKPEIKPQPELETKPEPKKEAKTEIISQPKLKPEPEIIPKKESKPELKPEPEPIPEPEPELKPEPKPALEPKSEPKPEPKPKEKPEPKVVLTPTPAPKPVEKKPVPAFKSKLTADDKSTQQLLESILVQLKKADAEREFSISRLLAGAMQAVVLFLLLVSAYLVMQPARQNDLITITLGFALVLQMMSLSLYIMQGRK